MLKALVNCSIEGLQCLLKRVDGGERGTPGTSGDRTKFSLFLKTYMKLSGYIDAQEPRVGVPEYPELKQPGPWDKGCLLLVSCVVCLCCNLENPWEGLPAGFCLPCHVHVESNGTILRFSKPWATGCHGAMVARCLKGSSVPMGGLYILLPLIVKSTNWPEQVLPMV